MKKSLFVAALLAGSCVYGANIQPFVGIDANKITASEMEINADWYEHNVLEDSNKFTFSESEDNSFGIKIGANIDNNHRVYLYHTKSKDNDIVSSKPVDGNLLHAYQEITYTTLNYDYKFTGYSVTPYVGAHAGHGKISFDDKAEHIESGNSDTQFIYGVQTGMIIPITNNIEFEMGLAYTKLNFKNNLSDMVDEDGVAKVDWKVDDMMKYSFGINYKF